MSVFLEKNEDSPKRIFLAFKKQNIPPPVGFEPTTFELEVQHASPLRHPYTPPLLFLLS